MLGNNMTVSTLYCYNSLDYHNIYAVVYNNSVNVVPDVRSYRLPGTADIRFLLKYVNSIIPTK